MADHELSIYYLIMATSFVCLLASISAISLKDRSWINWYSLSGLQSVALLYALPAVFMWSFGPTGSYFAYVYCYATYALVGVFTALGYCFLPVIPVRTPGEVAGRGFHAVPWFLLLAAFLLYLPVLIAFEAFIFQPREIYAAFSAQGYGINYFGSAVLVNLAVISYLFKAKKRLLGGCIFFGLSVALIYLHGSKGQFIVFGFMAVLYQVYIRRRKATIVVATATITVAIVVGGTLFALLGTSTDSLNLVIDMAGYADSARNAMQVIDDADFVTQYGRLELEDEFYSRMPRFLAPDKPKAFGQVKLAQKYYPQWYRDSAGTPSFGIGMQYADFGPASIFVLSICALLTGWFARSIAVSIAGHPGPGSFLMLLFFAGIPVMPLGAGYMLPEMVLLALLLNWLECTRIFQVALAAPASEMAARGAL